MTLCKTFVNTSRLNTRYFESTIFQFFFLNKLFVYLKYDRLFKIIFVGENKRKYPAKLIAIAGNARLHDFAGFAEL